MKAPLRRCRVPSISTKVGGGFKTNTATPLLVRRALPSYSIIPCCISYSYLVLASIVSSEKNASVDQSVELTFFSNLAPSPCLRSKSKSQRRSQQPECHDGKTFINQPDQSIDNTLGRYDSIILKLFFGAKVCEKLEDCEAGTQPSIKTARGASEPITPSRFLADLREDAPICDAG